MPHFHYLFHICPIETHSYKTQRESSNLSFSKKLSLSLSVCVYAKKLSRVRFLIVLIAAEWTDCDKPLEQKLYRKKGQMRSKCTVEPEVVSILIG